MADFECSTIDELTNKVVTNYSNKILLIYANNGIGKTRTSYCLRKRFKPDEVLCFSAFLKNILFGIMIVKMKNIIYK